MSINLIHAIDQNKVSRFGKYFGTIDFNVTSAPSKSTFTYQGKRIHVGHLLIAGKSYRMAMEDLDTLSVECYNSIIAETPLKIEGDTYQMSKRELEYLSETLKSAKRVFLNKYRLGV